MTASTEPGAPGPPIAEPAALGAPLRLREFRLLCVTQLATGLRMPMLFVTQAWYVNVNAPEDQRVLLLGLLATLRGAVFLAYVVFGGAFADRYPRRTMLIVSHALAFVATVFTGALLFLPGASEGAGAWLWVMFALFTGFALINAQDLPTRNAMIADIVPASMLTSAVTIFQLALSTTMLAGGPITGWTLDHAGFGTTYLIASSAHLVVLAAVLSMRAGRGAADPDARSNSVLENVRAGVDYLRSDAAVRWLVIVTWVAFAAGISVMGLLVAAWVRDILELDATGWGVMQLFWGAGGVIASGTLALRGEYGHKGLLMLGATLVFGTAVIGFGLSREIAPAFLFNGLAGGTFQLLRIVGVASVQQVVPNRLLGRVMSLLLLSQGIAQLAGLLIGAIGHFAGLEVLYPAAGVAIVVFALAVTATQRPLRTLN
jgi:MFS family permease